MKIIVCVFLYGDYYTGYRISRRNATPITQNVDVDPEKSLCKNKYMCVDADAYLLHPFLREVLVSGVFRRNLLYNTWASLDYPKCQTLYLKLSLKPPDKEIIDYLWNDRMLRFVWSRVEIDHALSWLSTLGGAFSALGDYFEHCAEMAGKISIRQLQLSVLLGDEGLAARSRLYSSLAIAQKGKLKLARKVVRSVATFARASKDRRLMRMCQGVWAKLRYLRQLQDTVKSNDKGDMKVMYRKEVSSKQDAVIV